MAGRRGRVARRFSDTSLEVLVAAVRARASLLFPPANKKLQSGLAKRGWQEVAQEVSRLSITPRNWAQCRKRFNDLSRSAREKAAHNMRERSRTGGGTTDIVALTPVEQSAMDISGTSRGISVGDGEAGGFSKHGDCFPVVPLRAPQAVPVTVKTSTSPPEPSPPPQEEDSLEEGGPPEGVPSVATSSQSGSAEVPPGQPAGEGLPDGAAGPRSEGEPGQPLVVGPGPVTSRRRAWSSPSCAEWHRDTDLRDPAIKRRMLEAHHRLYEVLEGLPKTLGAASDSTGESTSAVVSHVVSTLQTTLESATTSRGSAGKPPRQEPTPPTIEALIAAQTAAIQTLDSNICSTLERLVGRMDSLVDRVGKGFQMVSRLLQSALPQVGGSGEAKPPRRPAGPVRVTLVQETGAVSPPPQPIPDIVPNSHQAAAELPQPVTIPSRARAPRAQRSRTSPGSQDQSQQPPANCSTASPGATPHRSGKVELSH